MEPETDLEMAERHVRTGERQVARQRELIVELSEDGHATESAEAFLRILESMQEEHVAHLQRLRTGAEDLACLPLDRAPVHERSVAKLPD